MSSYKKQKQQKITFNYLPHNFLAEKIILSCLLTNSETIDFIICRIKIETFYFKNHQEIYKSIQHMYDHKMPIDIVTFTTFLQDKGLLHKIGGIKVLIELIYEIPNLIYLEEYIRLIKDKFLRRSLIKLGYETVNSAYITNITLENLLTKFENKLFSITNDVKIKQISTSAELLNKIFFELKEKSIKPSLAGISSGFHDLDSLTQGFQKSDLIIIAGRPSMGKTALSLNISLNILKYSKLPILFFSLEMSKEQIMYRVLAMETYINNVKLKNGKLSHLDWIKLSKVIKILSKLPFFIDDDPNLSIQTIRSKIKTVAFEQNKIGLIVIDYIQLMQKSDVKIENRVQELSQITRSLKNIAREFNIPIIALSQLSRSVETRATKKPLLSDLRESGSIEQDADLVLMLYNKSKVSTNLKTTELVIAKQRNGPVGEIQLEFNKQITKFLSLKCPEPDSNW